MIVTSNYDDVIYMDYMDQIAILELLLQAAANDPQILDEID